MIGGAADGQTAILFFNEPEKAFLYGLLLYFIILGLIFAQNYFLGKKINPEKLLFISNAELNLFMLFALFILGMQRYLQNLLGPAFYHTLVSIFCLTLYFGGLFVHHYSRHLINKNISIFPAIRFLIPFTLPFLVLVIIGDVSSLFPYDSFRQALNFDHYPWLENLLFFSLAILALLCTMVFLPPLLVRIWKCPPLDYPELSTRLETLCLKANFTHAGFKIWTLMEHSLNAAIMGVIGPLRYIMFTPKLVSQLPPQCTEAILAHEIGHNRYKHLWLYPFVLFGMLLCGWLAASEISEIWQNNPALPTNSPQGEMIEQLLLFIAFAAVCSLYFRFVFGYFSRLFERQADLYIFEVGVPAIDMCQALNEIANAAGGIQKVPNWHHHSIQERIDFLQDASQNPSLIQKHHKKVLISIFFYIIALILIATQYS